MNPCFFDVFEVLSKQQKRTKCNKVGTKCNVFLRINLVICNKKTMAMNDYIFLIALGFVFCSLAIVTCVLLYCRRMEHKCNYYIAKSIREQDGLSKELERTRIEKEMIEKVVKTNLSEAVKSPEFSEAVKTFITEKKTDNSMTDAKKEAPRIEITYFI